MADKPAAQAMVLAAGRGERMRPLTDTCPKPLLQVQGKPLIGWHLEALARQGLNTVAVNTAWLGDLMEEQLRAPPYDAACRLLFSREGHDFGRALETAGGIVRALPLLDDVFWVVAGDVFAPDFVFSQEAMTQFKQSDALAHLWLVPNPEHNPQGDFGLVDVSDAAAGGRVTNIAPDGGVRYTYSTIGLYRKALFTPPWCDIAQGNPQGRGAPLAPLLRAAMDQQRVTGALYHGRWTDVGTPQRLAELNRTI